MQITCFKLLGLLVVVGQHSEGAGEKTLDCGQDWAVQVRSASKYTQYLGRMGCGVEQQDSEDATSLGYWRIGPSYLKWQVDYLLI